MDPLEIFNIYYAPGSPARETLLVHSENVAGKALEIARRASGQPDLDFVYESAMLHDIGIYLTHAPKIGCFGEKPYICHGHLGRKLLEKLGYHRHALVAERHIGTGLTALDVREQRLPLPEADMTPQTLEEKIVAFADKFFTKSNPYKELALDEARKLISRYGQEKLAVFDSWVKLFG
ncbi:MAG: HD domain-containing protein [Nitrospiraceae bacterium]|nr:HD domain-containing protein [Nitrospiraceae bacterium]